MILLYRFCRRHMCTRCGTFRAKLASKVRGVWRSQLCSQFTALCCFGALSHRSIIPRHPSARWRSNTIISPHIRACASCELRTHSAAHIKQNTVDAVEICVQQQIALPSVQRRHSAVSDGRFAWAKNYARINRTTSSVFEAARQTDNSLAAARARSQLQVVDWNIAAPNNNPFEFWAMHEDEGYMRLMASVQQCIDYPAEQDAEIGEIFTDSMFAELTNELKGEGVPGLESLEKVWKFDLKRRKCITQFLKDTSFGEKRLISMPDRMTTSVKTEQKCEIFRPSPITGIQEDMSDIPTWWAMWKTFMFRTAPCLRGKPLKNVFAILEKIPRAKYPALTEDEEALSVPLQTLCLALFDAVYTHLLNRVAPETWQPLKRSLHKALFENKTMTCISILERQYGDTDVIFVQEASESFASKAEVCLDHFVLRPPGADGRAQMSLIMARRAVFDEATAVDVTDQVLQRMDVKCVAKGDLCVYAIQSHAAAASALALAPAGGCDAGSCGGRDSYLLASFHGDSDGKSTLPVLAALDGEARDRFPQHTLIFGLDANTRAGPAGGEGSGGGDPAAPAARAPPTAGQFADALGRRGLGSCWEGHGELESLWTTFNARTHLQPQLHKAVAPAAVADRAHTHLKDWIVFRPSQMACAEAERDNTGRGEFVRAVMPSQAFPSDHAIVAATLVRPSVEG